MVVASVATSVSEVGMDGISAIDRLVMVMVVASVATSVSLVGIESVARVVVVVVTSSKPWVSIVAIVSAESKMFWLNVLVGGGRQGQGGGQESQGDDEELHCWLVGCFVVLLP